MAYKTTKAIRDLEDGEYCYYAGAIYPRNGLEVSTERLEELVKKGAIVAVDDKPLDASLEESKGEQTHSDDELSVKEIKAKLDELGIEYKSRTSKADLLTLLVESKGA